jgi:hypothetical protein
LNNDAAKSSAGGCGFVVSGYLVLRRFHLRALASMEGTASRTRPHRLRHKARGLAAPPAREDPETAAARRSTATLLCTLFPTGIPPQQGVIVAVNSWLDEAERLTRVR